MQAMGLTKQQKDSWQRLLNWYHKILCHPNSVKQLRTMQIDFIWKNMQKDIETFSQYCHTLYE